MLNKPDKPLNLVKGPSGAKVFVDQISNLSPSEKPVVPLSSLLLDSDLLSEMCLLIVAPLQCCRHHQIQFFNISDIFIVIDFGVMRSSSDLATSISWIHCNASMVFLLSGKPLFGSSQSSSETQCGQGIFPDASPRKDKSELSCHFEFKSQYPQHGLS